MTDKLIITAAITGAGTTRAMAPSVPLTAKEIAQETVNVVKAGAAVVHVHVRDDEGLGTMDTQKFAEAYGSIQAALSREGLDAVINLTTSGAAGGYSSLGDDIRLRHLEQLKPEMCSFDSGTFNWGCQAIFENSPRFLAALCRVTGENKIKPEIEIFDGGMIGNALHYINKGLLAAPGHFQFVLGVLGGLEATTENLVFLRSKLPTGSTWSVTGIGKGHLPMMLAGLSMGCHGLRVGLEDNIYYSRGNVATNVQLVERAVQLGLLAGRRIASPSEARKMLGIVRG